MLSYDGIIKHLEQGQHKSNSKNSKSLLASLCKVYYSISIACLLGNA